MVFNIILTLCAFGGASVAFQILSAMTSLPRSLDDALTDQRAERLAAEARRELAEGRGPKIKAR